MLLPQSNQRLPPLATRDYRGGKARAVAIQGRSAGV